MVVAKTSLSFSYSNSGQHPWWSSYPSLASFRTLINTGLLLQPANSDLPQ